LARQGVNVAVVARSADKLEMVAQDLRQLRVKAIAIPIDLRDPVSRGLMVARVQAELGPVDILVNNAGITSGGRLGTRSFDQIQEVVETNLLRDHANPGNPDMLRRRQVTLSRLLPGW
jgi:3-oxoacyl-[acyl-carrier protein] reductase